MEQEKPYDSLWIASNLSVGVAGDSIAWVGAVDDLTSPPEALAATVYQRPGCYLSPGLIDCHTHLIYAGSREGEFLRRLQGESYAEIAKSGGGIQSTVTLTRAASKEELYQLARVRLLQMLSQGVTTVEIKSGYGLDLETEVTMLEVAKQLGEDLPVTVSRTYLGAHTVPKEYLGKSDQYIDKVCQEVLPEIKARGLADSVDVFTETVGFSLSQSEKVLTTALDLGFAIKCHAEQLSNMGASTLASGLGALSCDHVEYIDEAAVESLKASGTVAVLLPGAYYFLQAQQKPPVALLREHQVPMAVATDCNPGSSPTTSLPLMMNMACVLFGLTVDECWQAVTENAALALGLASTGTLVPGKRADFCLWPFEHAAKLCYHLGGQYSPEVVYAGQIRAL